MKRKMLSMVILTVMLTAMFFTGGIPVSAANPPQTLDATGITSDFIATFFTTNGTNTNGVGGSQVTGNVYNDGYMLLEYTYTHKSAAITDTGAALYRDLFWYPVRFKGGRILMNQMDSTNASVRVPVSQYNVDVGALSLGETYHVVAVLALDDVLEIDEDSNEVLASRARIFLNGAPLTLSGGTHPWVWKGAINVARLYAYRGTKATVTRLEPADLASLEAFDYAPYETRVTLTGIDPDPDIKVSSTDHAKFAVDIKGQHTVSELLSTLVKPSEASWAVFANTSDAASGTSPLDNSSLVPDRAVLKVTSGNGKAVLNYNISVTTTVEADYPSYIIDHSAKTISGILQLTPIDIAASRFIGLDGYMVAGIVDSTAEGFVDSRYVQSGMKLRLSKDGSPDEDYTLAVNGNIATAFVSNAVNITKDVRGGAFVIEDSITIPAEEILTTTLSFTGFGNGGPYTVTQPFRITSAKKVLAYTTEIHSLPTNENVILNYTMLIDFQSQRTTVYLNGEREANKLNIANWTPKDFVIDRVNASANYTGIQNPNNFRIYEVFSIDEYEFNRSVKDTIEFITEPDGSVSATVTESADGRGTLCIAAYSDEEGSKALSAISKGTSGGAINKLTATLPQDKVAGKTIRAFYWDSNLSPLCVSEPYSGDGG